jgi:mannonate dehydratase
MKITGTKVLVTNPGRNFVFFKIETDEGVYGWGDGTLNGRELAVAALLEQHISPLLLGRDPDRIEDTYQYLTRSSYWRGGPLQMTAVAAVDAALWDIKGKVCGRPVYSLLGGRTRDGALAYTHCGGATPEETAEDAARAAARGFKVVRIQTAVPGMEGTYGKGGAKEASFAKWEGADGPMVELFEPGPYMRTVPRLFRTVRDLLGDEIDLCHDVHQKLSPIEAARLAKDIEPYRPFFLEDPVRPEFKGLLGTVRNHSTVPIAIGELFFYISDFIRLFSDYTVDYIRCDLGHSGGITAGRKIAALAEPYAVKTAWHGPGDISPIMHAANVHIDVSIPNFGVQEMVFFPEQVEEVVTGGPRFKDGYLDVEDRPGLGTDVNEKLAAKYPYERAYLPTARRLDGSVHDW